MRLPRSEEALYLYNRLCLCHGFSCRGSASSAVAKQGDRVEAFPVHRLCGLHAVRWGSHQQEAFCSG